MIETNQTIFDPADFLNQFYSNPQGHKDQQVVQFQFQWTKQAFDMIPESQNYLQIGCGPVLIYAGIASQKCKNLYLTDYNEESFKYITKELDKKSQQKFYWEPHFKIHQNVLKEKCSQIHARLKERVVGCFKCDLSKEKIFQLQYLKKMDFILSSLCIECVAKNKEQYAKIIFNISTHLKTGGYLYLFGILEETYYIIGQKKFSCFPLNLNLIKQTLQSCGFEIIKTNTLDFSERNQENPIEDSQGIFSVLAKKLK